MNTQPKNQEAERLEAVTLELSQKIVDLEAEIERNHRALEGFMAENEALKAELGGKAKPNRETRGAATTGGKGRDGGNIDAVAIWRKLQERNKP